MPIERYQPEIKELSESKRMQNILEELKVFSEMNSASTEEDNMRNLLVEKIEGLGMKTHIDEKGNLWVPSSDEKEGGFLLTAHMDKVGAGSELKQKDGVIEGRLDDAMGMAVIMALLKEGRRPSVLFTVEEEAEIQTVENGENKFTPRDLPNGIYCAGARFATLEMPNVLDKKPKLIINLDVSIVGSSGVNVYMSSLDFHFPNGPLKDIAKILEKRGITGVNWINGKGNDSIEYSFNEEMGIVSIGPYVENSHTANELVNAEDVLKTANIIEVLLEEYEIINKPETPTHMENLEESRKSIALPDEMLEK